MSENGYAVIIRADITPQLDARQIDAVSAEAGGTVAYSDGTGILRYSISTPDPDASWLQVLQDTADTLTRAVRLAGATASIREARVLDWDDFEAETFRPAARRGGLASVAEVTEILGVSRPRVYEVIEKHADFPKPIDDLKAGPVWDRTEVEAWERGWDRRRTGRPRKEA